MPFNCDLALQNIPLPKQPFKTQPQIENEGVTLLEVLDIICPPQEPTSVGRALSLQEVELNGWFLLFHIVLQTCII